MTSEVSDLIAALRDGSMSLDEVARLFRERTWPRTKSAPASTYLEMAAAAQQDPEPYIPGSFDQVAAAYRRGELSRAQYRVLAEAVAESFRAEEAGTNGQSGEEGAGVG